MQCKGKLLALLGLGLLVIMCLLFTMAPMITPYNPLLNDSSQAFLPPSWQHLFGTDHFGRDIFSRILYGGRLTVFLSFVSMLCAATIGVFFGAISAYFSEHWPDRLIMRLSDILLAMPYIVLAMLISTVFGRGLTQLLVLAIAVWWAPFARLSRELILEDSIDERVLAAKVLGANPLQLFFKEILPNLLTPITVQMTFEMASMIASLATVSFFGMGAQPPQPEWGGMLADARPYMMQVPQLLIWPILSIFTLIVALNLLGEGLKALYQPYHLVSFGEEVKDD
ncbi:hypothetical protein AWM75_08080 [Aerococcus urinaehominis]|uniref:Uncharacterized protein n=1 Tax=Aerococcus urinaehominis TaxID=128944 RepID=A0A0X8FMB7_9LACT|nr:ABC transporter permease [Aerococcus urinaehominis]AMB99929.1 hypothetical protein AWM75_08080 [Aerococcus urinaehominis]SDM43066.1 peptide/nickel transport system permease protein [Aerococcus urinaehominis]